MSTQTFSPFMVPILSESAGLIVQNMAPQGGDEITRRLNEEALARWHDPLWQREQADVIAETLDLTLTIPNIFDQIIDTRSVGETEKVMFRERTGLNVFWTHRGGYIDETELTSDQYEIGRDTLGFHVREFSDKLRLNWAESLTTLLSYGKAAMVNEVRRRLVEMMQAATVSGTDHYVDATGVGGLTIQILRDAIADVSDAPAPPGTQGANRVTIMGRAGALGPIMDFAGYAPAQLEEIQRTGRLGQWRGAGLVELPNVLGPGGTSAFSDKDIWVFTRNVGHVVYYGGTSVKSWEENTVDYQHIKARRDVGISLTGLDRGFLKRIRLA